MPMLPPEECDPPYHNQWRTVLNPFFKPEAVEAFDDSIRREANVLIDAMFKNLLGLPAEDIPMLIKTMDAGFYGPIEERAGNLGKAFAYLGEYLGRRKDEPSRGDLIDTIAAGVELDGEPCPWADRVGILLDLALGGIVTATFVMSGGVYHLATHPADRAALVADPGLIPQAVAAAGILLEARQASPRPGRKVPMKVGVDRERCEAHGQCNLVSDELFPLDEDGYSAIADGGKEVPAGDEDVAEEGVYNCPARALMVEK